MVPDHLSTCCRGKSSSPAPRPRVPKVPGMRCGRLCRPATSERGCGDRVSGDRDWLGDTRPAGRECPTRSRCSEERRHRALLLHHTQWGVAAAKLSRERGPCEENALSPGRISFFPLSILFALRPFQIACVPLPRKRLGVNTEWEAEGGGGHDGGTCRLQRGLQGLTLEEQPTRGTLASCEWPETDSWN